MTASDFFDSGYFSNGHFRDRGVLVVGYGQVVFVTLNGSLEGERLE